LGPSHRSQTHLHSRLLLPPAATYLSISWLRRPPRRHHLLHLPRFRVLETSIPCPMTNPSGAGIRLVGAASYSGRRSPGSASYQHAAAAPPTPPPLRGRADLGSIAMEARPASPCSFCWRPPEAKAAVFHDLPLSVTYPTYTVSNVHRAPPKVPGHGGLLPSTGSTTSRSWSVPPPPPPLLDFQLVLCSKNMLLHCFSIGTLLQEHAAALLTPFPISCSVACSDMGV
jgi:hypothetical protein